MNANVDILKLPTMLRAFLFSIEALWAQVSLLNLRTLEPVLKMPVFLFLGRNDRWVPLEISGIYFDRLTAPSTNSCGSSNPDMRTLLMSRQSSIERCWS